MLCLSVASGYECSILQPHMRHRSATIFVVDDEPMLLDLAAAILQPLGFEVRTFRDPRLALEEFPNANPGWWSRITRWAG